MAPFVAQGRQATTLLLLLALAVARFPPLGVCAAAAATHDLGEFRSDVDEKQNQISFLPREGYASDSPKEREQISKTQEKLQKTPTEADATRSGEIWGVEGKRGGWGRVIPDMAARERREEKQRLIVKMAEDDNDEVGNGEGDNGEDDSSEDDNGEDDNGEDDNSEDKIGEKDTGGLRPKTEILTVCTPAGHAQVRITPARTGQTWRGWGTSLGWFANYIGKLPAHQLKFLLDLLFHPSIGLGLNLARYLIGGSFNPLLSPQFLTEACEAMAIPGYCVTVSGPYDWSADWRQRKVLAGAIDRGVEEVEAVAYSPPWWMTVSGDTAGLSTGKSNLKRGYYLAYAGYLADVVAHFREEWNVTFSTLNPANEALEGWWVRGNRQEGCNFNGTELNMLIAHVVGTLKRRRLFDRTGVAGFDSFAGRTFQNWEEFSPLVKSSLTRINVHGYVSPPENGTNARDYIEGKFGPLREQAEALGKEVWVSEMGPLFVTGDDMAVMVMCSGTKKQRNIYTDV
ncbi:unnamed protein product [Closterium sp. NIES-64]|nr:unnamed protein product [Closterium sp. NIES-64]